MTIEKIHPVRFAQLQDEAKRNGFYLEYRYGKSSRHIVGYDLGAEELGQVAECDSESDILATIEEFNHIRYHGE